VIRYLTLYIFLLLTFARQATAFCQSDHGPSRFLSELFNHLAHNNNDNERIKINDSIRIFIDSYARSDSVMKHRFNNIRNLGQILSPDSLIKIITWNLVLSSDSNRYYCFFIIKQDKEKSGKVYCLESQYNYKPVRIDTTYSMSEWYGALYYDIRPYELNNKKYWILLGIDYGNPFITRKIIDVLSFNDDGSPVFGKKLFVTEKETRFRDVFEYSSSGIMSLRFNSGNSVIFDHLVPFNTTEKNNRQFYGPDYSYDSYILDKDFWHLTINVEARNKE
jgi:hypothetical protein